MEKGERSYSQEMTPCFWDLARRRRNEEIENKGLHLFRITRKGMRRQEKVEQEMEDHLANMWQIKINKCILFNYCEGSSTQHLPFTIRHQKRKSETK